MPFANKFPKNTKLYKPVSYTHLDVYKRQRFYCKPNLMQTSNSSQVILDPKGEILRDVGNLLENCLVYTSDCFYSYRVKTVKAR